MKIVVVAPVFWPATKYGGPVYTMTALVKALASRGEEVTVLTSNLGNSDKIDVQIGAPLDFYGARLIYLNQRRTPPYGPLEELESYLDREARDADILHISSTLTRTTWEAMRWANRNQIPFAVTTRGHLVRRNWWKDIKKQIAVEIFLRRFLRKAEFLQATSTLEAEALRSYGFQNVKVIPHGVELPDSFETREAARLQWDIDEGEIALIALGRLHPVKGLELLIKATGQLTRQGTKLKLLIGGEGPPAYLEKLQELAKEENIHAHCRFVGQVGGTDKWSLLRAGDLFVHLSSGESFGLAIGEALGAGLPVLIGERCGWDEITHMGFGIRISRSFDAATLGLTQFLEEKDKLSMMGERAMELIAGQYHWSNIASMMVDRYRQADGINN